jgi:hypothetical protein
MGFHMREAIENYIVAAHKSPGEFLFGGCGGRDPPITTRQYAWLDSHRIGSIRPLRGALRPGTEPGLEATPISDRPRALPRGQPSGSAPSGAGGPARGQGGIARERVASPWAHVSTGALARGRTQSLRSIDQPMAPTTPTARPGSIPASCRTPIKISPNKSGSGTATLTALRLFA